MAIVKIKPVTAGTRWRMANDFVELTTDKPTKSLLDKKGRSGGRNSNGRMTVRYIGGGHKRKYRIIDFLRDKHNIPAVVKTVEYDPNRSAYISLLFYADGEKRYIIAPQGIAVGKTVVSGDAVTPDLGNCLMLKNIPLGTSVHNVELQKGKGAKLVRSAGMSAQLAAKEEKFAVLKMPSGELRRVFVDCFATVGVVSNGEHNLQMIGKAGRNRWKGMRPRNRGVAMNPVDHPMGGGEGKASGGHPRSRKGLAAKGLKTRNKKKSTNQYIIQTRKGKKIS